MTHNLALNSVCCLLPFVLTGSLFHQRVNLEISAHETLADCIAMTQLQGDWVIRMGAKIHVAGAQVRS